MEVPSKRPLGSQVNARIPEWWAQFRRRSSDSGQILLHQVRCSTNGEHMPFRSGHARIDRGVMWSI